VLFKKLVIIQILVLNLNGIAFGGVLDHVSETKACVGPRTEKVTANKAPLEDGPFSSLATRYGACYASAADILNSLNAQRHFYSPDFMRALLGRLDSSAPRLRELCIKQQSGTVYSLPAIALLAPSLDLVNSFPQIQENAGAANPCSHESSGWGWFSSVKGIYSSVSQAMQYVLPATEKAEAELKPVLQVYESTVPNEVLHYIRYLLRDSKVGHMSLDICTETENGQCRQRETVSLVGEKKITCQGFSRYQWKVIRTDQSQFRSPIWVDAETIIEAFTHHHGTLTTIEPTRESIPGGVQSIHPIHHILAADDHSRLTEISSHPGIILKIDQKNKENLTPLCFALKHLSVSRSTMESLGQMMPDTSISCDEAGNTPLHLIAQLPANSGVGYFKELSANRLADGPALNRKNSFGQTPLHLAVQRGNIALVKWLYENGATLSADDQGNTPLHFATLNIPTQDAIQSNAARIQQLELVSFLLNIPSAPLYEKNKKGISPFDNLNVANQLLGHELGLLKQSKIYNARYKNEIFDFLLRRANSEGNFRFIQDMTVFGQEIPFFVERKKSGETLTHTVAHLYGSPSPRLFASAQTWLLDRTKEELITKNQQGQTPLDLISDENLQRIFRQALRNEKLGFIRAIAHERRGLLSQAQNENGLADAVKQLLKEKEKSKNGNGDMHLAALHGGFSADRQVHPFDYHSLRTRKASAFLEKNKDGKTALELVNEEELSKILKEAVGYADLAFVKHILEIHPEWLRRTVTFADESVKEFVAAPGSDYEKSRLQLMKFLEDEKKASVGVMRSGYRLLTNDRMHSTPSRVFVDLSAELVIARDLVRDAGPLLRENNAVYNSLAQRNRLSRTIGLIYQSPELKRIIEKDHEFSDRVTVLHSRLKDSFDRLWEVKDYYLGYDWDQEAFEGRKLSELFKPDDIEKGHPNPLKTAITDLEKYDELLRNPGAINSIFARAQNSLERLDRILQEAQILLGEHAAIYNEIGSLEKWPKLWKKMDIARADNRDIIGDITRLCSEIRTIIVDYKKIVIQPPPAP
jgi:ankyrin repeat protein